MIDKNRYKYVLQKNDYDCGVAASATLLLNAGVKRVNYFRLSKDLGVNYSGVPSSNIAKYFLKKRKLKSKLKLNSTVYELKQELAKGRICMVAYQSWGKKWEIEALECGHYSVAVGIYKNKIYLIDPTAYRDWGDGIGWRVMGISDFEKKWIDKEFGKEVKGWMLSILPIKLS